MNLIAVTSGKGGTGKSCVAAYVGVALSEAGRTTLLLEQGVEPKSLDVILAAQTEPECDLEEVVEGRQMATRAVVSSTITDNLFLIPSGIGPYKPQSSDKFIALLKDLRMEYDYIILDGVDFDILPPSLFDMILLVTTPDTLSVRACRNKARDLFVAGADKVRLVINNVPSQVLPIHGVYDFDDLINVIGAQLIAVIPQSPKLQFCSNNAQPLDEESITIQVFDNLAARIRGQQRPLLIR